MSKRTAHPDFKPLTALALGLALSSSAFADKSQTRQTPDGSTTTQAATGTTVKGAAPTSGPQEQGQSTFDAQDAIRGGRTENQQNTGGGGPGLPAGQGTGSNADRGGIHQNNGGAGSNSGLVDDVVGVAKDAYESGKKAVGDAYDSAATAAGNAYSNATTGHPENGVGADGTRYVDGKPYTGKIPGEGTYNNGKLVSKNDGTTSTFGGSKGGTKGGANGRPVDDDGSNGPGGTSGANGGSVNTAGGKGPTDDGGRGGTGTDGGGTNAAGRSFNGGGRGGSDDPLNRGDEGGGAFNRNRVNPGNSDPIPDGTNSPRSYSSPQPAAANGNRPQLLIANSEAGRFGTRYRLSKGSPFAVQVDRAEYSLVSKFIGSSNQIEGEITANRTQKLLYVYGTITNVGKTVEEYPYRSIEWAAVGGNEIEARQFYDYPVRLDAKSGALNHFEGRLVPGSSIPVVWVVALPPEGAARSFSFNSQESGLRLSFPLDRDNPVAGLPSPYASGADAATVASEIAAEIGPVYAGPSFDVSVQGSSRPAQVLGELPGDHQAWLVVNVTVRNHRLNVQDLQDSLFTPVLRMASGSEVPRYDTLDGKQDVAARDLPKLMWGASRSLRLVFRVPADDEARTLVWTECVTQPCSHPLYFSLR